MNFTETWERIGTGELLETNFKGVLCFWTLTTGRSGTLTLARLMDATLSVIGEHEPWPTLTHEGKLWINGHNLAEPAARRLLHVARGGYVEGAYARKKYHFDSSLFMSHMAHMIQAAFVESRWIHLIRPPREFIRSALAKGWYAKLTNQTFFWPIPPEGLAPPAALMWLWNTIHARSLELEAIWGTERVYRLFSDDLFSEDIAGVEKLFAWMGIPEEEITRMRGKIWHALREDSATRNKAPDKLPWDPQWEDTLQEIAGPTMEALGLE